MSWALLNNRKVSSTHSRFVPTSPATTITDASFVSDRARRAAVSRSTYSSITCMFFGMSVCKSLVAKTLIRFSSSSSCFCASSVFSALRSKASITASSARARAARPSSTRLDRIFYARRARNLARKPATRAASSCDARVDFHIGRVVG